MLVNINYAKNNKITLKVCCYTAKPKNAIVLEKIVTNGAVNTDTNNIH